MVFLKEMEGILEELGGLKYLDAISKLHSDCFVRVEDGCILDGNKIRLLSFKFDNILKYEVGNCVDFKKLDNVVTIINSPNASGKSSFIDALIYAIYDINPRNTSVSSIVNNNSAMLRLELKFEIEIGGVLSIGIINKTVEKLSSKSTCSLDFLDCHFEGSVAKREINKLFGRWKTVLNIQQQNEMFDFIDTTPLMRKNILSSILLEYDFDKIYKQIKEKIKILNMAPNIIEIIKLIKQIDIKEDNNNILSKLVLLVNKDNKDNNLEELEIYNLYYKILKIIEINLLKNLINKLKIKINNILELTQNNFKIIINENYELFLFNIINPKKLIPCHMVSGYQKFITSISIRIALWELINTPKLDILIIDEGFGVCDNNNIKIIINFLNNLTHIFKNIIIISHIIPPSLSQFNELKIINNTIHNTEKNIITNTNTIYCQYCSNYYLNTSFEKHLKTKKHIKNTNNNHQSNP